MMIFEFGKYTDVTITAKGYARVEHYGAYTIYDKVLICPDTWDVWVCKIQSGYNAEFEREEGKVIVERNKLDGVGARNINPKTTPKYMEKMVTLDVEDGCNWDVMEYDSIDEALEDLDGGFGIIKEYE